jgi:hypothetical protein
VPLRYDRSHQRDFVRHEVFNPWFALTVKTIELGLDAQRVVALRMMRLAAGGARGRGSC